MSSRIDYDLLATEHFPRVARTLRLQTIPDDLLNHERYRSSRQFLDRVAEEGFEPLRVPMPIDWEFARRELAGELAPSYTNGDLIYGVNNGGKFSVDVTYLAEAEATGYVRIETLHRVNDIERGRDGTRIAHTDRTPRTVWYSNASASSPTRCFSVPDHRVPQSFSSRRSRRI
ncbi:hypothetical protein [Rhodococcus sp. 11-3]|uniref:hypothetical protein n=1 Tax=Rhodococcus TaxID=1827 RepID=UPI00203C452B|nr:hypothetical protein [Rhodococcus sp. 11-3]